MSRIAFHDDWTLQTTAGSTESITLPHDAMIGEKRSPGAVTSFHGGFFPGGRYLYSKTWAVPSTTNGDRYRLHFEGVQGLTSVRINGNETATNVDGYREFAALIPEIEAGTQILIEVDVDNTQQPNSRWYTGSGIYRPVWLETVPATHLAIDGVGLRTIGTGTSTGLRADIAVSRELRRPGFLEIEIAVLDGSDIVGEATASLDGSHAQLDLDIREPRLWSAATPFLYDVRIRLLREGLLLDERTERTGLRTVSVDSTHGLLVNGAPVLLRGACVHHDNGILGAATLRVAEFRRVRILKENGFNAIRSAHNPASRHLLEACDELGMYVMDELTDYWYQPKTAHDLAHQFDRLWRDSARSMVAKDRNHPSVIMYSIGNEVAETATPRGVATTREIHNFIHDLDADRPTTVAISLTGNAFVSFGGKLPGPKDETKTKSRSKAVEVPPDTTPSKASDSFLTSTMFNVIADRIGPITQRIARSKRAGKYSRDAFAEVDVAGYNYAWSRYHRDAIDHPDRVMVGSESLVTDLPDIWREAQKVSAVIGDFLWTGWEYLGETGLGTWTYGSEPRMGIQAPYPHLASGSGMIDLIGVPGSEMLYAQAIWADDDSPRIAVRPLDAQTQRTRKVLWRLTDAVPSWSWRNQTGSPATIEIYSGADEVDVLINGTSLGRKQAGPKTRFLTRFHAPYQPGEVTAIAYRDGREVGRSTLTSAEKGKLRLIHERSDARGGSVDGIFVRLEIADEHGVVEMSDDDEITLSVAGPGRLLGFGSAAVTTEFSYSENTQRTYRGRALAVIQIGPGNESVSITASSTRHGSATATLT
ncbi:Beta-galactosidase BoGH2A [Frondihabitans sp. 762G35]|uniref:glycoside hydrolase family 2 TIM barrel-domain containing protein n=1 Tax=Frondihabitans sp. 762G35 TaxID=1446794 RepID=UPI000D222EDA|nr:glycoside hydrolase family 2 TIM barrel-domain containing protein [Frondihabitans sp. 762G35]ARC58645.1 Beta-galactosidase BoGH2A [Frondihabitans sp. 762G35]